ncbi:hypothetical protein OQA88_4672 [Cercophora sp. LCS_1]
MPLRAKLVSQQPPVRAMMSTKSDYSLYKPLKSDDPEDVLFNSLYGLRTIQLNRPRKLNALNGSMIRKITPRLLEWAKSDMANVIVIKGAGDKAFCAGGDVAELAIWNKEGEKGQQRSIDYFALEYQLDHLIATYEKPYIAIMDGITMGGGVGLSMHAPLRIATERTLFAMPETTIGLFPDVGGSFFLPRLPGAVGTYLALTSERVKGVNVFYSGLATHYLHSSSLPALESRLAELRFPDAMTLDQRLVVINDTIEEFVTGLPHNEPILLAGELRKAIDRCFGFDTVDEIVAALKEEQGIARQWAEHTLNTLRQRSPTSVHVTLRQMRLGKNWSIQQTFEREHQIASVFMKGHDFTEGVTAKLIEKREPKWQPETLDDILPQDKITDPYFKSAKDLSTIKLLEREENYKSYPFAEKLGLPSEAQVEEVVRQGIYKTPDNVVAHFLQKKSGKQGVREVVSEILARKTTRSDNGLEWVYQETQE